MKKKNKTLCISEKKACIIGIIMSLIFSLIFSFGSSSLIIDAGFGDGKVTIMTLAGILFPILFIVFGMFALSFIAICSAEKKK